ncbi:cobaltochelatase subunit CobN [Pseudomonas matsuisoli]|uniref:Cobaltochelatase subunit CobN n=2 Tax=Pseudomonas matsuisoli TaxID=1515666 RepID=A0A917PPV2_9PSED|nr:cobaltochelatase subunit CobN [Pseudomonas matsuisoli]GGJ87629.1 cobaltochelatase subunit CobN [Pseudomonas matsuisoli]
MAFSVLVFSGTASANDIQVRIVASEFVLSGKFEKLRAWAQDSGAALDTQQVTPSATIQLSEADLLILDTPRPSDVTRVTNALGDLLETITSPWIRVGGGPPAFGNLPAGVARQLIGYYANGGERNGRHLFAYLRNWRSGLATSSIPQPETLAESGIYHPDAPGNFTDPEAYLRWGSGRWPQDAARVAFAIHRGSIVDGQLQLVDDLIRKTEARGMLPLVFWFDDALSDALQRMLKPADVDVLVNLQHMQNGAARKVELEALDIPVLQAFTSREGSRDAWRAGSTGIAQRSAVSLMALPESWGMVDPLVIAAVENGEPAPIEEQVDALLGKAERLARLRHKPEAEKRIAVMFWNHPGGERNIAASNLNIPRSLAHLSRALKDAGYGAEAHDEAFFIDGGQRLLAGFYRPETLETLLHDDLAEAFPLSRYTAWFEHLPQSVREPVLLRWGQPDEEASLRTVRDIVSFVIPRLSLGNVLVLPQAPRGGRPGENYHDTHVPPDHRYLATYFYLRERFGADALVHFGTHGTQEWLPGKDRGLWAYDYPFLAVGDVPTFYPYIQDNIGEAMQARRRGRAVTVSHQTPPFAPAGLYDELRDLHALIHEHEQLEEGAVRQATEARIEALSLRSGLMADVGWTGSEVRSDFAGFLAAVHDHLHRLAAANAPLGLHTFGEPAAEELRSVTVLQQLGKPYLAALGIDGDEPLALHLDALKASPAYRTLRDYLGNERPLDEIDSAELRELLAKARTSYANLEHPEELESLLAGLDGRLVAPGPGGDPVRNPDVPSGRNLYAFEADKLPTRAAYEAGGEALDQLVERYRSEHDGVAPTKLAFSLWSSEAMRHLGILESEVLHALGLRPVWDAGGRVKALEIIPASEMKHPRIDVVVQVTSVYRDQFDGFMRLLAEAIDELAVLNEPNNAIAANSRAQAEALQAQGVAKDEAERLSRLRLFSNAPGDYGTGVSQLAGASTEWDDDSALADQYLDRLQYAYGRHGWGETQAGVNLFAEQLRGTQAAVLARSSELHGVLSTDHAFEYLGGLSSAIRRLDGESPSLYIADLRKATPKTEGAAGFLSAELRSRYLNPQWIGAMQNEGYAGTLEILNVTNNLWGWQAMDRHMVCADQWQALHDTFIADSRALGINEWFEAHNPTAQAQLIERMAEAVRKGYWDADEQTRQSLAARYQTLTEEKGADAGNATTQAFIAQMSAGFGMAAGEGATNDTTPANDASESSVDTVSGQVLREVPAPSEVPHQQWPIVLAALALLCALLLGAVAQWRRNGRAVMFEPSGNRIK